MTDTARLAVITGASSGIGLETARQLAGLGHHVIITGRQQARIDDALAELGHPDAVEGAMLDVSDDDSVAAFFDELVSGQDHIDILINNAARSHEAYGSSFAEMTPDGLIETIDNNAVSAFRTMRHALPLMNEKGYGRIVNVSSGAGQFAFLDPRVAPYRISKVTMNAITVIAAQEAKGNVKVNAVDPGWVKTRMGGDGAQRDIPDGAAGIVWAATLPDDGPNGGFFKDGQPIAW